MPKCSWPATRCFMSIKNERPISVSPMSRRAMLGRMCGGFGLVSLLGLLDPQKILAAGSARLPHFTPRAKRVIFLFLNGGPSHVDTFDPKPALSKFAGQTPTEKLYKKGKTGGFMPSPFT